MAAPFTPKIDLVSFYNSIMPKKRPAALHHVPILQALEDFRIRNLMIVSGPGNGKSTCTSIVYPAWLLGHDPSMTILALSAGENLPQGFMNSVGQIIAHNPAYHRLFPNVRPDKKLGWSSERGLFVTGHDPGDPDASYIGMGLTSKALTGKHARGIIMDDLHDRENSGTDEGCRKIRHAYYDTILGRGDPQDCRYVLSGRRFSTADIYGHFIKNGDWCVMILPAERPGQSLLYWDIYVPRDPLTKQPIRCVFSENLHPEPGQELIFGVEPAEKSVRYKQYYGVDPTSQGFYWPGNVSKHIEYFTVKRNMPITAEATYQCNPGVRENAVFTDEDFCYDHELNALQLLGGRLNPSVQEFIHRKGGSIIQSWDTGYGQSQESAYSVCITALLEPCKAWWRGENPAIFGEPEKHHRVHILDVYRKKIDFSALNAAVRVQFAKWGPQFVLIENRASGISLVQNLKNSHIPVKPIAVTEGKVERATDAIGGGAASVQGWMRQHRVVWPKDAKWLPDIVAECRDFMGTRAGYKDQVDALVHLVQYAIMRGVGDVRMPSDEVLLEAQLAASQSMQDPRSQLLQGMAALEHLDSFDPFGECCGRCDHWDGRTTTPEGLIRNRARPFCNLQQRPVSAIDSCYDFTNAARTGGSGLVLRN